MSFSRAGTPYLRVFPVARYPSIMSRKKLIPLLLIVILLVLAYVVKAVFFSRGFSYAGTVEVTKVDVPARVSSVIAEFPVKEGELVDKDQPVLRLACEDLALIHDLAQKNFDRSQRLFRSGGIPQEAYDVSKNKRDDIATRHGWCQVKSPLKGTVLNTYFEAGEMVSPGMKLLTVGDLSEVYAYFYLPHDEVSKLRLNQDVKARLPEMDDKSFPGTVSFINPEAEFTPKNVQTREERTRLVYAVKVRFKNPDGILKPGMTLEWPAEDL